MTNIDYPVTYICKFTEPLGEHNSKSGCCIDRATALAKAKEDFQNRQFINCIEFYDDELKMSFTPDNSVSSSGDISVTFSDNFGWSEHVDDHFP